MTIKDWFGCNFHTSVGLIYLQFRQHSNAEIAFSESIAICPTSAAYCGLGISFVRQENYDSAIKSFWDAIELNPRNAYNHRWRRWTEHLSWHKTAQPDCLHCVRKPSFFSSVR
jgi:lipoprotein NlpI